MPKEVNMEEWVDHLLFNKPIKKKKIKESEVDIKKILEQDEEEDVKKPEEKIPDEAPPEVADKEPIPEPAGEEKPIQQVIDAAKSKVIEHETDGDMVLELSMKIAGKSIGKLEIGSNEYATITNFNIIFNKFGINYKEMPNTIKSFSIIAQEVVSQTDRHNVSLQVEMIDQETLGIQLFIDEQGIRFDVLEAAIKEFDRQYGINIIDTINKKIRE